MITIKPNKEESRVLNWLKKAGSKDIARPTLQTVYVKNGKTVSCDGMRLHIISTPECLKEIEGMLIPQDKNTIRADSICEFNVYEGTYPDIDQIMPHNKPVFRIGFNPKFPIDALSGFDGNVVMNFYGPHEPMLLTSVDKDNEQKALVMPVFIDPEEA